MTIYSLTRAGAQAIGQTLVHQHYRMPSREAFVYRTREARIATQAEQRGFVVYRGTPASPLSAVRALQHETRQVVVKHWRAREKAAIAAAKDRGEFVAQRQTQFDANVNPVPLVFREWYIHRPNLTGRILLVARKEGSRNYWQARIADMAEVGKLLRVVCIFAATTPCRPPGRARTRGLPGHRDRAIQHISGCAERRVRREKGSVDPFRRVRKCRNRGIGTGVQKKAAHQEGRNGTQKDMRVP